MAKNFLKRLKQLKSDSKTRRQGVSAEIVRKSTAKRGQQSQQRIAEDF